MNGLHANGNSVCSCDYFIHINYQDILDNIILPLIKSEVIGPRHKLILNEYAETLRSLYNNEEIKESRQIDRVSWLFMGKEKNKKMEKEDKILELLRACGMTAFVNYLFPALSKDYNVTVQEVAEAYPEFRQYTANAQNTRVSKARSIFGNEWERDALEIISNATRVPVETRLKAKELLEKDII